MYIYMILNDNTGFEYLIISVWWMTVFRIMLSAYDAYKNALSDNREVVRQPLKFYDVKTSMTNHSPFNYLQQAFEIY